MKKYVNGYAHPRFKILNPYTEKETIIDLSSRYQYLTEYYEKITDSVKLLNGAKVKRFLHYDLEWQLSFSQMIESPDLLAIQQIEQADASNYEITLIPHTDYPFRSFRVQIKDEKREISLSPHFHGADSTFNKGFVITFENVLTVLDPQIIDVNYIPVTPFLKHPSLIVLNQ